VCVCVALVGLQLIRNEDTSLLGLVLLHTASEELACPRDNITAERKRQLMTLMLRETSAIFALLNGSIFTRLSMSMSIVNSYIAQNHEASLLHLVCLKTRK